MPCITVLQVCRGMLAPVEEFSFISKIKTVRISISPAPQKIFLNTINSNINKERETLLDLTALLDFLWSIPKSQFFRMCVHEEKVVIVILTNRF